MSFAPPKNRSNPLRIRTGIRAIEDWWFDTTRSVETSGHLPPPERSQVVGEISDSLTYSPVRAANARAALRELPLDDYSNFTFLDIGSGKGRVLFVAAEYPFRKVVGVEFATHIHELAVANIHRYNHWGQKCANIESINANAAEFEFPNENLVIYLANPFGPEVMGRMLANLDRSIERNPRHVIVLLLWPERSYHVSQVSRLEAYKQTRRHHIYQTADPILRA
jgi:SAM-dependent methyltransferase